MMNDYDNYELKRNFWKAATSLLYSLSSAAPFVISTLALAFLLQSALSEPFSFSCKSTPTKSTTRMAKPRPQPETPVYEKLKAPEPQQEIVIPMKEIQE